jgi:hypothetical protein
LVEDIVCFAKLARHLRILAALPWIMCIHMGVAQLGKCRLEGKLQGFTLWFLLTLQPHLFMALTQQLQVVTTATQVFFCDRYDVFPLFSARHGWRPPGDLAAKFTPRRADFVKRTSIDFAAVSVGSILGPVQRQR